MTATNQPTSTNGSDPCNTMALEPFDYCATFSPEDNKIRISGEKRFDPVTLERVKAAGFRWAPNQQIWVAPMWTPEREDLALELAGEMDDEGLTLAERAADRAERFSVYSSNRMQDATRARDAVAAITEGIPAGQPILVGHHSERRARKDAEKIENGMRKAVSMWESSDYWKRRAAGALAHAKYKELPDVRHRRIKGLEADKRKQERALDEAQKFLKHWLADGLTLNKAKAIANLDHISKCFSLDEYPRSLPASQYEGSMSLWSALDGGVIDEVKAREIAAEAHGCTIARASRWIAHYDNRIAFEREMLGEQGGLKAEGFDIQAGGRVLVRGEWAVVLRVNKKGGKICSVTTNARYVPVRGIEEVTEYRAPSEEDAAKVKKVSTLAPMVNYPGEGFVHMTKAEWESIHADYKGSRELGQGAQRPGGYRPDLKGADELGATYARHRVRSAVRSGGLRGVFLTDSKRVDPPAAQVDAPAEPVTFERQMADVSAPRVAVPDVCPVPTVSTERNSTADDFKAMKEQLKTGVQVVSANQLFPTPPNLAARMVRMAGIMDGDRVLEPSAGTGRLVQAIRDTGRTVHIVAVEINRALADRLSSINSAPGDVPQEVEVITRDFLELKGGAGEDGSIGAFDIAVLNPPYENAQDILHIRHALSMLKPGGKLVALCANGPRQRDQLRPLVEQHGGEWEDLPPNTFESSGTAVNTALFTLIA